MLTRDVPKKRRSHSDDALSRRNSHLKIFPHFSNKKPARILRRFLDSIHQHLDCYRLAPLAICWRLFSRYLLSLNWLLNHSKLCSNIREELNKLMLWLLETILTIVLMQTFVQNVVS
jgi:hypothetical protein